MTPTCYEHAMRISKTDRQRVDYFSKKGDVE